MVCEIPLTRGFVALVDDDDYPIVKQYKWRTLGPMGRSRLVYAVTGPSVPSTTMHGVVVGMIPHASVKLVIDHIDGNGLNNRRANLRVCSHGDNISKGRLPKAMRASGYIGVHLSRTTIEAKCGRERIGAFPTITEAARAYDFAARQKYGIFAVLNFPNEVIDIAPIPTDRRLGILPRGVKAYGDRFIARASIGRKDVHIGIFNTIEEAVEARRKFDESRAVTVGV